MRKNYMLAIFTVVAAAITSYFFIRNRSKNEPTSFVRTLMNAGLPDQVDELEADQLENSKMVSEGAQFGVQYYNQTLDELNEQLGDRIQHYNIQLGVEVLHIIGCSNIIICLFCFARRKLFVLLFYILFFRRYSWHISTDDIR